MNTTSDDSARRAYWAEQMQLGYELVQRVLPFEVRECGEGFASIPAAAESAGIEMLFSTTKIAGELDRIYFMRESLVPDVMAVGREMNARGWILKIEDGYRSLEMQRQLVPVQRHDAGSAFVNVKIPSVRHRELGSCAFLFELC